MRIPNFISSRLALLLLGGSLAACSPEGMPDKTDPATGLPTLAVSIGLAGQTRADAKDGDFETGVGFENHLDIAGGDYRIYFFDKDNKFLATFDPYIKPTMSPDPYKVNGVDTYFYDFVGQVPPAVGTRFKLVVLANWGKYPEEVAEPNPSGSDGASPFELVKGKTTIEDLTTHPSASFSHLEFPADGKDWLGPDRLIPFYGVRDYDLASIDEYKHLVGADGKLKDDAFIDLKNDNYALPLIRAMARIEVILDNPYASFESVEMTRINNKGYCAPYSPADTWKFDHTDYFHGYDWDNDFFRGVHDYKEWTDTLAFKKVTGRSLSEDGKTAIPEKWVAYVPEYKNIGIQYDFARIKVVLANPDPENIKDWDKTTYTKYIYFATDGSEEANSNKDVAATRQPDGTFTQGRFDIERNNIYRFEISEMTTSLKCRLDVQPFAEQILEMEFGLMRDERGDLKVLTDADGNLPKYFTDFMNGTDSKGNPRKYPMEMRKDGESYVETDIPLKLEKGDYFAIVLGAEGSIKDAKVWLKDSVGCRVLTNFVLSNDNDQECSTRQVVNYIGMVDEEYFNKDTQGEHRIYHFINHCSVVMDNNSQLYFKDQDNKYRKLVESFELVKNEAGTEIPKCWIIFNEKETEKVIDGKTQKVLTTTFRLINQDGSLPDENNLNENNNKVVDTVV